MRNNYCWLFFHLAMVPIAIACSSKSAGLVELSTDTEKYNQPPWFEDTDTTTFHIPQKEQTPLLPSMLGGIEYRIRHLADGTEEICRIEQGSSALTENPDGSVTARLAVLGLSVIDGVPQKGDGWRRQCSLSLNVPWVVEEPPGLPWTWTYQDDHLTNPANSSIKNSWTATGPHINIIIHPDGGPGYDEQVVYPNPPDEDPYSVFLEGYMRILEGSAASWEHVLFFAEAWMRVEDHAGMKLEVTFSFIQPVYQR